MANQKRGSTEQIFDIAKAAWSQLPEKMRGDIAFHATRHAVDAAIRGATGLAKGAASIAEQYDPASWIHYNILGLPYSILGNPETGKTTLDEMLRKGRAHGREREHVATPGAVPVEDFWYRMNKEKIVKLKPKYDLPGQEEMRMEAWPRTIREVRPLGVIFILDHINPTAHKEALRFALETIEDAPDDVKWRLKAFFVLANKSDQWMRTNSDFEQLWLNNYKEEAILLRAQAAHLGYKWNVLPCSLTTGDGVNVALKDFFETISKGSLKEISKEVIDRIRNRP